MYLCSEWLLKPFSMTCCENYSNLQTHMVEAVEKDLHEIEKIDVMPLVTDMPPL